MPGGTQPESRCSFAIAVVVAVEKREEIFGEVALVFGTQRADDAEIDGRVLGPFGIVVQDENIAGVHVGVEEVVPEYLREKDLDAVFGEHLDVGAIRAQRIHVADRRAEDAFLHQHFGAAVIPVDLGYVQHIRALKVAFELSRVGSLAHQVELIEDRVLVFVDNLERFQSLAMLPISVSEARKHAQDSEIAFDLLVNAGAQNLDDDLGAVLELAPYAPGRWTPRQAARYRSARIRRRPIAVSVVDNLDSLFGRERWDRVLQFRQLVGDVGGQQVAACRDGLAELDEDRSKLLERKANAFAEGRSAVAASRSQVEEEAQGAQQVRFLDDVIEPVLHQYALDREQAEKGTAVRHFSARPADA